MWEFWVPRMKDAQSAMVLPKSWKFASWVANAQPWRFNNKEKVLIGIMSQLGWTWATDIIKPCLSCSALIACVCMSQKLRWVSDFKNLCEWIKYAWIDAVVGDAVIIRSRSVDDAQVVGQFPNCLNKASPDGPVSAARTTSNGKLLEANVEKKWPLLNP